MHCNDTLKHTRKSENIFKNDYLGKSEDRKSWKLWTWRVPILFTNEFVFWEFCNLTCYIFETLKSWKWKSDILKYENLIWMCETLKILKYWNMEFGIFWTLEFEIEKCCNLGIYKLGDQKNLKCWRRRAPGNMKIGLIIVAKSWIWDQHIPENMKWCFGNMGSLNLWTLKPRNQETKKSRNQQTFLFPMKGFLFLVILIYYL